MGKPRFRIGQSYDVHPLTEGRPLILAGVKVPYERGLAGHSDADVVFHAVADALLGALALGDLGNFFPDTDPKWKGVDSSIILREVAQKVTEHGYTLSNVDVTVIAEKPKLAAHMPAMRESLARVLRQPLESVSIKARTHEKLGTLGRGEGIASLAIVLVEGNES